ncbi:MAG: type II toxin-antitoxin system HicA family toxin [Rhodocyclaceae bacterium]|jgi:mRNA interferase HicA|nr:type II toxin-antitoxin system HicA family toxin [Rhodocyclaceae bacterium]
MTGNEFIRKVKALGKRRGIPVKLNASRGKGSHQTLYYGTAFTVVRNPKDELKTGTLHAMCAQIGIRALDL